MAEKHPGLNGGGGAGRRTWTIPGRLAWPTILLAVAAIAAWRGWALWYRGILEHDEGHALLNASTYRHVLSWVLSGGPFSTSDSMAELRDTLHREGGTLYSAGKSGYSLLLAVVGLPGDVSQALALFMAWAAGLLVLGAAGALTYKWYGNRLTPAAVAVAGLALSPLLGSLSREVSGTIWALAFGMMGLTALAWSGDATTTRRRALQLIGGLLMGCGFTCHFNLAPFMAAALLAHAFYLGNTRQFNRLQLFPQLLLPVMGVLLVPATFQLVTWLADRRLASVYPDYLSFAGELRRLIFSDQVGRIESQYITEGALGYGLDAWKYLASVAAREGYLFLLLIAFAIIYLVRLPVSRRLYDAMPPLILFLIPTVFWIVYPFKVERVFGMCIISGWMLVAGALDSYWQIFRARNGRHASSGFWSLVALIALALHITQVTVAGWIPLWRQRSPIPGVVATTLSYMQRDGGVITAGSFNTGFAPVWKWTIVEALRQPHLQLPPGHVDFSRFDGATIIFLDPASWRSTSREFPVTKAQVAASETITVVSSQNPPWSVSSHALTR